MNLIEGIILGFVQGLTEFIPVSSSGHLILVRDILGINYASGLMVDAILQLATILAVGIYFRRELASLVKTFFNKISGKKIEEKDDILFWAVVVGTIPAIVLGLLLEDYMSTVFRSSSLVALALLFGSLIMFYAEKRVSFENTDLSIKKGLFIGLFQSLALIPGVSRSGATISGGMLNGMSREESARFSFILSFPIILGSGLKMLFDMVSVGGSGTLNLSLVVSFFVAFVSGFWAIRFLISFLSKNSLKLFIIYRVILALLILFVF